MADIDEVRNCPVCFDSYNDTGEKIPRILNCFHTLCEKCVKEILKNKKLECPQCRAVHPAPDGCVSFPQNKYIISALLLLRDSIVERCEVHKREICAFCDAAECQKPICMTCMFGDHRDHMTDLEDFDKKKDVLRKELFNEVAALENCSITRREMLQTTKELLDNKGRDCENAIRKRKYEILEKFDNMAEEAMKRREENNVKIDEDITKIDEELNVLKKMRGTVAEANYEGLKSSGKKIKDMKENGEDEKMIPIFKCREFSDGSNSEDIFGKFTEVDVGSAEVEQFSK